jgi:hypothetical protein
MTRKSSWRDRSSGTKIVPYGVRIDCDRRYFVFQVWEFHGPIYDISMFFVEYDGGAECRAHVMRSQYCALPVVRLLELLSEAGFEDVRRFDDRFFQPLLTGRKPRER